MEHNYKGKKHFSWHLVVPIVLLRQVITANAIAAEVAGGPGAALHRAEALLVLPLSGTKVCHVTVCPKQSKKIDCKHGGKNGKPEVVLRTTPVSTACLKAGT